MEKVNHLSEANTAALISGVGGLASQIIATKQQGGYVSPAENQVANLSQQTLQALGIAQAQQQQQIQQPVSKGLSGTAMLLIGGGVLLLIVLVIVYKSKK